MKVLNLSDDELTSKQKQRIETLTGNGISEVCTVRSMIGSFDSRSIRDYMNQALDRFSLSAEEWRAGDYVINLPIEMNPLTLILLLFLIRVRSANFPKVIRLTKVLDEESTVAEIVDIEKMAMEMEIYG